ncbi:hypothetical protein A6A06_16145 [Streptomyces sp. CB02923]|uniref:class I SAM-dependent DNA methyltransferase n=1 Tax=Streptomyces sp. CB02923 TaxID=1718985 RepID=UPI00093BB7A7|nr:class I SAM-dependent methyltransferase [Streptomyces sp. CB02923]OKI02546.1 hypothetical protein A6A06_16145 [Streptomyces sp. CB02923]
MTADIISYFRDKADRYDEVDQQVYWRLSDELLWDALNRHVLEGLPEDFAFLDAGGGTGRWTAKVLDAYPRSGGLLVDLSEDMLAVAAAKRSGDRAHRMEIVQGNLEALPEEVTTRSFDVIWNFHNVIGFLTDPAKVIATLSGRLKPGGRIVTLAPNRYHSAYFNLANGRLAEARNAVDKGSATFTDDMPPLRLFTPRELADMYERAGCSVEVVTGFPATLYPSFQETQIEGSSKHIVDLLEDPQVFADVLDMEKTITAMPDVAARGNNIFIVGKKG